MPSNDPKLSRKVFGQLAEAILGVGAKKATRYLSPNYVIKAAYRGKRYRIVRGPRTEHHEILFTIGRPNYEERLFIKQCKKAGEPFPVKKIQLKWSKGKKTA